MRYFFLSSCIHTAVVHLGTGSAMDLETISLIILTGLIAGSLSSLVGIGGGVIIVPILVMLLGFTMKQATGTSLAMINLPVGIFAVLEYHRKGYVDWKIVAILAVGFVAGTFIGKGLNGVLPGNYIKKGFGVIMILLAIKMIFFDSKD